MGFGLSHARRAFWRRRFASLAFAAFVVAGLLSALAQWQPTYQPTPYQDTSVTPVDAMAPQRPRPKPVATPNASPEHAAALRTSHENMPARTTPNPEANNTRARPLHNGAAATQADNGAANESAAPELSARPMANALPRRNGRATSPLQLSAAARGTIHDQECARIDIDQRPKDCPPMRAMREAAEEARHRPSNAHRAQAQAERLGRSRAERNAARFAGMRDPCELDSGVRAMGCIAIGPAPSRVRTWQEICAEAGLGGCTRPPIDPAPQQRVRDMRDVVPAGAD